MGWTYTVTTPRDQRLVVTFAKHVGVHPQHGLVRLPAGAPLAQARELGVTPLLLFALNPRGTPWYWIQCGQPLQPLGPFLEAAWRAAERLRGPPDRLLVSWSLSRALDPLAAALTHCGVRVQIIDRGDREQSRALHCIQQCTFELAVAPCGPPPQSTEALNERAVQPHLHDSLTQEPCTPEEAAARILYEQLPRRAPASLEQAVPLDWIPGPWLWGYEAGLERNRPCRFVHDPEYGVWLVPENPPEATLPPSAPKKSESADIRLSFGPTGGDGREDGALSSPQATSLALFAREDWRLAPGSAGLQFDASQLRAVLASWPNSVRAMAQEAGLPLDLLLNHLSGRQLLSDTQLTPIYRLLGFRWDPLARRWEAEGPCLFLAGEPSCLAQTLQLYACGGDFEFGFPVLPRGEAEISNFTYFLFKGYSGPPSVVMIPRGHELAADPAEQLCGLSSEPTWVAPAIYEDLMRTCAAAARAPADNVPLMSQWAVRHREIWCGR